MLSGTEYHVVLVILPSCDKTQNFKAVLNVEFKRMLLVSLNWDLI